MLPRSIVAFLSSLSVVQLLRVALGEDGGEELGLGEQVEAVMVEGGGQRGGVAVGEEAGAGVGEVGARWGGAAGAVADEFFQRGQAKGGEFVFPAAAAFVVEVQARRQAVAEVHVEGGRPLAEVVYVERFVVEGGEDPGFPQPLCERVQQGGFFIAGAGEAVLEEELFAFEPHCADKDDRAVRVGGVGVDDGEEQVLGPGVLHVTQGGRGSEFVDTLPRAAQDSGEFANGGQALRGGLGERRVQGPERSGRVGGRDVFFGAAFDSAKRQVLAASLSNARVLRGVRFQQPPGLGEVLVREGLFEQVHRFFSRVLVGHYGAL